tara:strand:+ start:6020 stop:6571 length:552 start_codon:yes stop_codon:yes gene_type:complete
MLHKTDERFANRDHTMPSLCDVCNLSLDWISDNKLKMLIIIFKDKLPEDILYLIVNLITHNNGHTVTWTHKSRYPPISIEDDIEEGDHLGGYYWNETVTICSKCFIIGLGNCILNENQLPYLRCHSIYFTNIVNNHFKKNKKNSEYILRKCHLPSNYIIDYYSNNKIVKDDNNNIIKIKNFPL